MRNKDGELRGLGLIVVSDKPRAVSRVWSGWLAGRWGLMTGLMVWIETSCGRRRSVLLSVDMICIEGV